MCTGNFLFPPLAHFLFTLKAKTIPVRSRVVRYLLLTDFPSSYASQPEPHQYAYCLHVSIRMSFTYHVVIDYPVALWAVHKLGGIVT